MLTEIGQEGGRAISIHGAGGGAWVEVSDGPRTILEKLWKGRGIGF